MIDFFTNFFINRQRYRTHSEAVIVSCFFNPQNSPYRLLAFQKFYRSIKHLNHRIIECVIGDAQPQLPKSPYITQVRSESLLWHKEALLNKLISELPKKFKYIFWLDADVKFTNMNWLVDSVQSLRLNNIIQPFEYCVHLNRNQNEPDFDVNVYRNFVTNLEKRHPRLWRGFCANYVTSNLSGENNYDVHGHVGFAWGARREILEEVPLYDRALIGGADHIMAHAAAGQIPHECISKSFKDDIEHVEQWMNSFCKVVKGRIGFVSGDLYHYWHGDISKRQYLKRIKDFTSQAREIDKRDENGLYVKPNNSYLQAYFRHREVSMDDIGFQGFDEGFYEDMGYNLSDLIYNLSVASVSNGSSQETEPFRGAGSDTSEVYPNNEDSEPMFVSSDDYRGAGNDDSDPYLDNEIQVEADTENFS